MKNDIEISLENKIFLNAKVGDHKYTIECSNVSRYGEAADALFALTQYCIQAHQDALKKLEQPKDVECVECTKEGT